MKKEKLQQELGVINFPHTYQQLLINWPELIPLLESFQHRDQATFMHSVAVHFGASRLFNDLTLLLKLSMPLQQEINIRAPWWKLHDIGKNNAHKDMTKIHQIIYPPKTRKKNEENDNNKDKRTDFDKAKHWIHPQMSATLIKVWSKYVSENMRPVVYKWAQLSYLHDEKLNPFLLGGQTEYLNYADKLSLFLFLVSDTSMAMGLLRPHKNFIYSNEEIKQVLTQKILSDNRLKELFPKQNTSRLRDYILVSVFDSLKEIKNKYSHQIWINHHSKPNDQKVAILDKLVVKSWQESESLWMATVLRMGIF